MQHITDLWQHIQHLVITQYRDSTNLLSLLRKVFSSFQDLEDSAFRSYRGSLRAEGKRRILQFLSSILALIIAFLREKRYIMIKERIELVERDWPLRLLWTS